MASGGAPAPVIALIGADGSGKSTLAPDLIDWMGGFRPTQGAYLGLGTGAIKERIQRWPLVGEALAAFLAGRGDKAHRPSKPPPGWPTARIALHFSRSRRRRFDAMWTLADSGVAIVTDRYPRADAPSFYDGPSLARAQGLPGAVGRLAAREAALYAAMNARPPALVLRLDIDLETALARKPDHSAGSIQRKVQATPALTFGEAPIVAIDARRDYPAVLAAAKAAIIAAGIVAP